MCIHMLQELNLKLFRMILIIRGVKLIDKINFYQIKRSIPQNEDAQRSKISNSVWINKILISNYDKRA